MNGKTSFGQWLKRQRKTKDLTQAELGARVGCAAGTIRKIEAGQRFPSKALALSLANRLGVPSYLQAHFVEWARGGVTTGPDISMPLRNFPPDPTPFIGRQVELAEIRRRLADPDCRLLTITGIGGVGKSRLALTAGRWLADEEWNRFPSGAAFVPLAGLGSARLLAPSIAAALGLSFEREGLPERQLLDFLARKKLLLVLDNYEHLLPDTKLVMAVLEEAPDVKLVVTSRERLGLHGEWLFEIVGLPYLASNGGQEEAADVRAFEAVRLFESSAQRSGTDLFNLTASTREVVQICRLTEGLPLALELAAGWMDVLSLPEIVSEMEKCLDFLSTSLQDVPARQRSIRASFEVSWQRLDTAEQLLFASLSVFRGGFTRQAAAKVAGANLQGLQKMVHKSLLQYRRAEKRYHIHELLRQYAVEKLKGMPDWMETNDRHLAYFLARAEEIESHHHGSDQLLWLARLETEHNNLIAALHWAWEQGKAESMARLSGALGGFWGIRGYLSEGKRWLATALEHRQQLPSVSLAMVLFALGDLAIEQGDYETAKQSYTESLVLWREVGNRARIAEMLNGLGYVAEQQNDLVSATDLHEESLALYRALGDESGIALALNRLGHVAQRRGDLAGAAACLEQSLTLRRRLDDRRGMASSLNALAEIARYQGDYLRAATLYEESLDLCRQLGDKRCIAGVCHNLGHVACHKGDYDGAEALFKESLKLYHDLENTAGVALCLAGLAAVTGATTQPGSAAQLFGASKALLEVSGASLSPSDQQTWVQNLTLVRGKLGEADFEVSYASGRAMSLERAVRFALANHE